VASTTSTRDARSWRLTVAAVLVAAEAALAVLVGWLVGAGPQGPRGFELGMVGVFYTVLFGVLAVASLVTLWALATGRPRLAQSLLAVMTVLALPAMLWLLSLAALALVAGYGRKRDRPR
jgi:hypothetical protein